MKNSSWIKRFGIVALALVAMTFVMAGCKTDVEPPHEHTFSDEWTSDATHHWHAATCGHTDEVSGKAEHTIGDWIIEDGMGTKKCSVCDYVLTTELTLKGTVLNPEYDPNVSGSQKFIVEFKNAIIETGATIGTDSNVEKIVFGLLSNNEITSAISNDTVKATKQDIGVIKDTYYTYYDESNKTVYIVPADAKATKFLLNENCRSLFNNFQKVKEIKGLDLLDTSNVTDMYCMFDNCKALTTLDVSKFDTSKVTNMGYMFYNCKALTTLDLSNFNTSNVTDMRWMFNGCNALTTLDVSSFDTSNVTSMYCMFYNCHALTTLGLSSFDTSNVTVMSSMFTGCNALTTLDVSSFVTSKVTTMSSMFHNCKALTTLDVSSFDTSNVTDMSSMFAYTDKLKQIIVADKTKFVPEGCKVEKMFDGCGVTNVDGLTNKSEL